MLGTEVIRVRTVKEMSRLSDDERQKASKSGSKRKSKASDGESDEEVHSSRRSQKKKKVENDSKVQRNSGQAEI